MKYKDNLKEIHLKGNRLTPQGIIPFLKTVKENYNLYNKIEVLDLSFNKLSDEGLRKLCEFINDPSCELKELNLEGNCLGDSLISLLCDSVSQYISDKIQVLNLGKNFVSRKGALSIANLIQNCYGLNVLILCWNDIKNFEAAQIINKLRKHEQMRVLDLSFNSIGNHLQMSAESLYTQEKQKNNPKVLDKIDNNKKETKKSDKNDKVEVTISNKELFDIVNKYNPPKRVVSSYDRNSNKKQDCSEFSRELGEYFKETSLNLIHMDISHNNINYNDCLNISIFSLIKAVR